MNPVFSRRRFIASFAWGIALIEHRKSELLGWGHMDPQRHAALRQKGIWLRAFLDGKDVTADCFEADDQIGSVGLFKRNEQGRHYVAQRTGEIVREFKHGRVEFRQVAPWE